MPRHGMDARILGLLTSSDYSVLSSSGYEKLQMSIGRKCSEIIYGALAQEDYKVSFAATIYEIINESITIATQLMFGNELQFLSMKYHTEGDVCSLETAIGKCPVCEYVKSNHPVCDLLSGFFAGYVQLFLSRFARVEVDSREEFCLAAGDSCCGFTTRWRTPIGMSPPRKQDIEIRIDDQILRDKVREIEELDFYRRAVTYARQRRSGNSV